MLPGGQNPGPFPQGRPHDLPVLRSHCRPSPADTSENDDSASSFLPSSSESDSESLSFSDEDEEDDHAEAAHVFKTTGRRSKQSAVPWTEFASVRGWSVVENVFKRFTKDSRHMRLISRSGNICSSGVTYRHECACSNTIKCP